MNCEQFEANLVAVARGEAMDDLRRESTRTHVETCPSCASRLRAERALSAGLRALAAAQQSEETPARVEATLRAGFRDRWLPAAPTIATVGASGRVKRLPMGSGGLRWALAAAAVALLAVLAVTALRAHNSAPAASKLAAGEPETAAPTPTQTTEDSAGASGLNPTEKLDAPKTAEPSQQRKLLRWQRRMGSFYATNRRSRAGNGGSTSTSQDGREIATDFIPLMSGEVLPPPDGGQMMRVELPRTALVRFGLPMNIERSSSRIKADVVVGNDGLARAIRFVH